MSGAAERQPAVEATATVPVDPATGQRRRLLPLVVATVCYLVAAWTTRPGFYDGFAPSAPYNWVSPPPQSRAANKQPASGHLVVPITGDQTNAIGAATDDGQAQLLVPQNGFTLAPGTTTVTVDIRPVADYPAISGFQPETNVYLYSTSMPLGQPATITLRFAADVQAPTDVYRADSSASGWTKLAAQHAAPYFIGGTTAKLGYFVAGSAASVASIPPAGSTGESTSGSVPVLPLLVGSAIVLLLPAGLPLIVQQRRLKRPRPHKRATSLEAPQGPNRGGRRRGKRRRR